MSRLKKIPCEYCRVKFSPASARARFCSAGCSQLNHYYAEENQEKRACVHCGKGFWIYRNSKTLSCRQRCSLLISSVDGKRLAKEYRSGHTLKALGEHYGISYAVIRRLLAEQGAPLRPPGARHLAEIAKLKLLTLKRSA